MTVLLWIAAYLATGAIVGKLAANIFLNREYKRLIACIKPENYNNYMRTSYPTYEEYVLSRKKIAYESALDDTRLDRMMSQILGTLVWPGAVLVVIGYYVVMLAGKISAPRNGIYLSAASRDIRKTGKNLDKTIAARELENKKIDEWNNMVDILNENGLNDVTKYEKKVKVK